MSSEEILTDDYVAELLAKEAADCSIKYSAMGLDAYKASKRPANQPKPNTRFLNNIIRDTNSHNRALLAKENAESQARLRELEEAEKRKQREEERRLQRTKPGLHDTRKRMLGDIAAHLGGPSKKRKTERAASPVGKAACSKAFAASHSQPSSDQSKEALRQASNAKSGNRSKEPVAESSGMHRSERASERSSGHGGSSKRRHEADNGTHEQKDLAKQIDDVRRHTHRRRKDRNEDTSRESSDCEERKERKNHRRRHHSEKKGNDGSNNRESNRRRRRRSTTVESCGDAASESDPLDNIIGPAPPSSSQAKEQKQQLAVIRRRGRGANAVTSGIDTRFAPDYDPRLDVTPDPDPDQEPEPEARGDSGANEGWDDKVEAFRDRQKWKQQGAERLRSAGFTEDEIRKWEKGGRKDESDVRWNKKGGLREWDRGKVFGDDGQVTVEAEWGRLKGT